MRSLVGMFLSLLFYIVDLETSNGLMPSAGEPMMLNRLLMILNRLNLDTYGGVDRLGVSSISKEGCGYYCFKTM